MTDTQMLSLKTYIVLLVALAVAEGQHLRQKRNTIQFGRFIMHETRRNPLDFNGYGKWCGFGGSGTPVDAIDQCCQAHDTCLAATSGCNKYFVLYKYRISGGDIICGNKPDSCARDVCECDRIAAECFGDNIAVYNPANKS